MSIKTPHTMNFSETEISFIKGSIFETEQYGLDAVMVFIPCGLTAIRCDCVNFIKKYGEPIAQFKDFFLYQNKTTDKNTRLKYILLDRNPSNRIYDTQDLREIVDFSFGLISKLNVHIIGLNGIRTSSYPSEFYLVREVEVWLLINNHNFQHIYFIDKRDGFNKHV